jgi:hypothetical protein
MGLPAITKPPQFLIGGQVSGEEQVDFGTPVRWTIGTGVGIWRKRLRITASSASGLSGPRRFCISGDSYKLAWAHVGRNRIVHICQRC